MMNRNSQWEDEVIDLENQVTHLLNKLGAIKKVISELDQKSMEFLHNMSQISRIKEILEGE